jgi:hypothetical protein
MVATMLLARASIIRSAISRPDSSWTDTSSR